MRATRTWRDIAVTSGFKVKRFILVHPGLHQPARLPPRLPLDEWECTLHAPPPLVIVYVYIYASRLSLSIGFVHTTSSESTLYHFKPHLLKPSQSLECRKWYRKSKLAGRAFPSGSSTWAPTTPRAPTVSDYPYTGTTRHLQLGPNVQVQVFRSRSRFLRALNETDKNIHSCAARPALPTRRFCANPLATDPIAGPNTQIPPRALQATMLETSSK